MLEQERNGIFYYHSSTLGGRSGRCCPGPVTLKGGGDVEKKWPKYLGQYQTSEHLDHHGAPVYVNSFGRLLFVNDNGDWSANTVINNRGVLRGADTGNRSEPCVAAVAEWRYWDEDQWTPADITVSCGTGEQGRDMI